MTALGILVVVASLVLAGCAFAAERENRKLRRRLAAYERELRATDQRLILAQERARSAEIALDELGAYPDLGPKVVS